MWAIITLYRARGDQIQEFGYAAFGLTVAPYAFMSVMNIIASSLSPEYPAIFLVRTPMMAEAESKGGFFVGEIHFQEIKDSRHTYQPPRMSGRTSSFIDNRCCWLLAALAALVGCIPLVVIGSLSGFQPQRSSALQRGFTKSWVVLGVLGGPIIGCMDHYIRRRRDCFARLGFDRGLCMGSGTRFCFRYAVLLLYFGVPAIGGMVMVGQMMHSFGACKVLGDPE